MTTTATTGRVVRVVAAGLAAAAAWVVVAPERFAPGGAAPVDPDPAVTAGPGAGPAAGPAAGPGAGPGAADPDPAAPGTADGPAPATTPDAAPDLRLVEVRGGWRDGEDLGTAAALAVLVARAEVGASTAVAVEAVEQPGPGAAVVTLLVGPGAPVPGADGTDGAVRARRLAVPVHLGPSGVRVAGSPWWLPGPRLDPDVPVGRPLDDAALRAAAATALAAVGSPLAGTPFVLEATDGWPFLARPPDGADGAGPGPTVWLRWHLDRFVVAGLPLHPAAGWDRGTGVP